MSERDSYPRGLPCWVEVMQRDLPAGLDFYGRLFSWKMALNESDPGSETAYAVARRRDRDVAGLLPLPAEGSGAEPVWLTHVRVDSADAIAATIREEGGEVLLDPRDVPPAGRLVVARDPAGATFGCWEPGERQGSAVVNEPNAWAISKLVTDEVQSVTRFYEGVFGWRAEIVGGPDSGTWMWRLPGYFGGEPEQPVPRDVVALMRELPTRGSESRWDVDFWVDDVDVSAKLAKDLGGSVISEPHDEPAFRSATLADPQGAVFTVSRLIQHGWRR